MTTFGRVRGMMARTNEIGLAQQAVGGLGFPGARWRAIGHEQAATPARDVAARANLDAGDRWPRPNSAGAANGGRGAPRVRAGIRQLLGCQFFFAPRQHGISARRTLSLVRD